MSKTKASVQLKAEVVRSNALHQQYLGSKKKLAAYEQFVALQLGYFLPKYDGMRDLPGFSDAIDFVVSDLTGTGIASRDQEIGKVVPVMTRFLPDKALESLALAMTLNARVLEINLAIAARLLPVVKASGAFTEREYCAATREVSSMTDFDELIGMTRAAGESLAKIVKVPMIRSLLRSMRLPARMAGVTDLQVFLEKGFDTFIALDDVEQFLDTMEAQMREIFGRVFNVPLSALEDAAVLPKD